MKKFMIFIFVLLLLIIGAVLLLPKFVPLDKVKTTLQAQVKKQINRDLNIDGAMKVAIWPDISVNLTKVSLSNADWAKSDSMIALDEVDIELKLMPLLKKNIEVARFVLHKPQIFLEVNKSGKGNWEFDGAESSSDNKLSKNSNDKSTPANKLNLKLGEFKIIDGMVNYEDLKQGDKYLLDNINVSIDANSFDSPIQVKGKANYRARTAKINFEADKLSSIVSMSPFAGKLSLQVEPFLKAEISGDFLKDKETYMNVGIDTDITDITALSNWISSTGNDNIPFKSFNLSGKNIAVGKRISGLTYAEIPKMEMSIDNLNMSGNVNFQTKPDSKPNINAGLKLSEVFDIPAFLNKISMESVEDNDKSSDKDATANSSSNTGWSEDKMDLSALHSINGRFTLDHQGLVYKDIKTSAGKAIVSLSGGKLDFSVPETSVDKGSIQSKISLKEGGENSTLDINMQAKNMAIQPILNSFADVKMLSGSGSIEFAASSKGQSQKSLISGLNGKGMIKLADGEIQGINLVNIAQMMQKRLSNVGLGDGGTKFTDLNASFNIINGILVNKDMALIGPLVEASGAGDINLPAQSMQYRIVPQVVLKKDTVTDAETGKSTVNTTGLAIPVDIKGAWSNLKVKPDYKSLINNVLSDPEKLKDVGRNLEDNLKEQIDVIKQINKNPEELLKDPAGAEQMLKGIFGR